MYILIWNLREVITSDHLIRLLLINLRFLWNFLLYQSLCAEPDGIAAIFVKVPEANL